MNYTDEQLLEDHREEQRQKREDERLRAERRHELWVKAAADGGMIAFAGLVGAVAGALLLGVSLEASDTSEKEIESLNTQLNRCWIHNYNLRTAAE